MPLSYDKQSFQINGKGNFTILSIEHQTNIDTIKTSNDGLDVEGIQNKIEELKVQKSDKRAYLEVYEQEEKMILKNNSFGGTTAGVSVAELEKAAIFYRARLTDLMQKMLKLKKEIKAIDEDIAEEQAKIKDIHKMKTVVTGEAIVTIHAKNTTTGKFTLQYLVADAGWMPSYDLRVKNIESPMSLVYKANVYQKSGEDWNKVKLTLSTGTPGKSNTKPTLQPWYIRKDANYVQPKYRRDVVYNYNTGTSIVGYVLDEMGEPLPGATVTIKGTTRGTVTDIDGRYKIDAPQGSILVMSFVGFEPVERIVGSSRRMDISLKENSALEEVVVTGYGSIRSPKEKKKKEDDTKPIVAIQQKKETKMEFKVNFDYTISSDGKKRMVEMTEYSLPSEYTYEVIPKINAEAFLIAKVTGWTKHNLISGEANLFLEGTYLGKSILNTNTSNDTLSISLGTDDGIVVTRESLKEYNSRQTIGGNQKDQRAWEIEVRNNKSSEITILIEDQIPVTTIDDVEVDLQEKDGAELEESTGKLTWKLKIPAKKSKKVKFKYQVKLPKKADIDLE